MKEKNTISVEYKKPIHLFRDDLLAIEKTFKEDLACTDFEVSFDDFSSDDIKSIPTNQKLSHSIFFHGNKPYFSIEIGQHLSKFYALEDLLLIRGAIQKIKNIFDKTIPKSFKTRKWIGKSMYGLMIFSNIFLFISNYINYLKNTISSLMILLLTFLCVISWVQMMWPMKPIIEFEMKNSRKNFWDRNKDQIYVGLLVGITTAIISFTLVFLSKVR